MTRETHLCFCRMFSERIVRCNSDWGQVGTSSVLGDTPQEIVQREKKSEANAEQGVPRRTLSASWTWQLHGDVPLQVHARVPTHPYCGS